jgi:hypothetical protein
VRVKWWQTVFVFCKRLLHIIRLKVKQFDFGLFVWVFLFYGLEVNYFARADCECEVSLRVDGFFLIFFFLFCLMVLLHFRHILVYIFAVLFGVICRHFIHHFPHTFHLFENSWIFLGLLHQLHHIFHASLVEVGVFITTHGLLSLHGF